MVDAVNEEEHEYSSATVNGSLPVGRLAAVARDWMVPRLQSTEPVYASVDACSKMAGELQGVAGGCLGAGEGGGEGRRRLEGRKVDRECF